MTGIHRLPAGADPATPLVRPAIVINDPALCASQPPPELAASAANALGHAVEGPFTPFSSPVPALAAAEAIRLIAAAYADEDAPDRDALALAALLSGYAIGSSAYGLHHVASQTLVRLGGIWHGHANAALLPHSIAALRRRSPQRVPAKVEELAIRLAALAGATSLTALGLDPEKLPAIAAAAAQRPQLRLTPPAAEAAELLALYRAAL